MTTRPPLAARRPGTRGRVVMLTDNSVLGDSRVQKEAQSAASAGWDVVLLGRTKKSEVQRWQIGGADVMLLPFEQPLGRGIHEIRRPRLRAVFAYPPGKMAGYRRQMMAVKQRELRLSRSLAADDPSLRSRAAVLARRSSLGLQSAWVGFRLGRTQRLKQGRRAMTSPMDRFATEFWEKAMGPDAWRRLDPSLRDLEFAFGPTIDSLQPDLIHANDFRMLGVAATAKLRARADGRAVGLVWDVHEFLPGIKPWDASPRWHRAQVDHEKAFAPHADEVVTVSQELGDLLVDQFRLDHPPTVVLNAPWAADALGGPGIPSLRVLCGVDASTKLVVYSGSAAPQRGLGIMIEALPQLPGVHVALVVLKPQAEYPLSLLALAKKLGVRDRVHVLPYVAHDEVVAFLAEADAGAIPIHHWPNHEIALITKFFEYSHARLPLVVSDVRTMGDKTRETGQGEVFVAEDLDSYVAATRAVLADPARYRAAYDVPGRLEEWTWEKQASELDHVYSRLAERIARR
ncbi:MAG TPA: glycosyltransferase [Candidatus Limnocylindria bacterium]|nr:glycosyltransferase [Candidatus Limnocylindria bacterium]